MKKLFGILCVVFVAYATAIVLTGKARATDVSCEPEYMLSWNVDYLKKDGSEFVAISGPKSKSYMKAILVSGGLDADAFLANIPEGSTVLAFQYAQDKWAFITYDQNGCAIRKGFVMGFPTGAHKDALAIMEKENL